MAALVGLLLTCPLGIFVFDSDAAFETVLSDSQAWAVLLTSTNTPGTAEGSATVLRKINSLAPELAQVVFVGTADVAHVKSIAAEFNIRARRCPKLLLFATRARDVEEIDVDGDILADIKAKLVDNPVDSKGFSLKRTLAVGAPDEL